MNIKLFRKRQGITQEKLAELMEVHENTIRAWEKSLSEPQASDITRLSKILHCTELELLNGPRDGKIELVVSWNWEDYKKGEINMFDEKFLMVLGTDGRVGLQGAGTVTNKATLEEFLGRVREQLEIALDAQIRRGVVVQEA